MRDRAARRLFQSNEIPVATGPAVVPAVPGHSQATDAAAPAGFSMLPTLAFLAVHPLVLYVIDPVPQSLMTLHAVATFLIGAYFAVSGRLDRVMAVVAYIAGAEVLWRMTKADIYWEFGKYATSAILLLALARQRRQKPPMLQLLYFVLLIPSTFLTVANRDWVVARDQISFNLSGPFALMTCAWFFANVVISAQTVRSMAVAAIAPILGVATLAATSTFSGSDLVFLDASNVITSGGFGPNQVSSVLGFGALLALFVVIDETRPRAERVAVGGVMLALVAQAALTFSRSGLYMAAGGAAVTAVFALSDVRLRARFVTLLAAVFVVGNFFVVPYLDAFTGGAMGVRFQDTDLTGRDLLIQADIDLWKQNPLLGVGPGEGKAQRGTFFSADANAFAARGAPTQIAAHTEFSRMLAEHGSLGFGALLLFVIGGLLNVRRAPDARARAIVAGLAAWSALFMLSTAMRVVAPSLAFGIGFAVWLARSPDTPQAPVRRRQRNWLRPLTAGHPARPLRVAPEPQTSME